MTNPSKINPERIEENAFLKQRIRELEHSESERKRAEESLRESEERYRRAENDYRMLFREMLDGFALHEIIYDGEGKPADYRFLAVNPAFEGMTGLKAEDIVGRTVLEAFPGTERHWIETYGKVALTGEPAYFENYSAKLKKHFEVTAFRPSPNQFACIFSDITKRRQAEETLRRSEENYRQLYNNSPVAIYQIDFRTGKFLKANDIICEYLGCRQDEISSLNPYDFMTEESRQLLAERLKKMGSREPVADNPEYEIVDKNGRHRWLQLSSKNIFDAEGLVVGADVVAHEITDRKLAEEALQKSEERFRLAYSTSPDAININRMSDGLFVDINEGFTKLTGYAREDVIGRTSLEINVWHSPADRRELIGQLKGKGFCENLEADFRRRDGSVATALMSAKIIVLQNVPHILSITRDISDRKRAEEEKAKLQDQLLQSQKMESVGRLAGGVAHDFNNMLGVILGHTEMALEEVDPALPLHAGLEEIRKAANRSADLTRQLLAFARKQVVSPRVLDLNDTVAGMLKMLQRLIGEDIHLAWLPDASLWPVRMDPSQIDQILANLSVNARDAIAGIGRVTIETKNVCIDKTDCADHAGLVPGEYVLLVVSDDGCGMDREILGKLFEPFFTTKGVGKGTGLGLATVYGIVKQNNGFIHVYSEPGQGTTFRIYLPRHIGKAEQAREEGAQEPAMPGHETVLVVEDEPALLDLSRLILEKQGYRVLAAATPGEAIRLAEEHAGEIHLLLTDVVMPEMNGRDLAKRMLSLYPNMKRLFMSGYTADVIAHRGILDDGACFIQKPFSRKDLTSKVREALGDGKG